VQVSVFFMSHTANMVNSNYTFLALGDSYTIGEAVAEQDNFPSQAVQILNKSGFIFAPPEIVAKTGWTTGELLSGIRSKKLQQQYDFVSLLIGVNNQYRGRDLDEYTGHFDELLQIALYFTGNKPKHVFVISIPDWGVTPFAQGRDRNLISTEIDAFNLVNRSLSEKWNVNYIEITAGSRKAAKGRNLITSDGLHPSAKEYKRWAEKLAVAIQEQLHSNGKT
jgi:lysophospholipase L1-like esterase